MRLFRVREPAAHLTLLRGSEYFEYAVVPQEGQPACAFFTLELAAHFTILCSSEYTIYAVAVQRGSRFAFYL